MTAGAKSMVFWMVLVLVAAGLFATVRTTRPEAEGALTYSQFLDELERGQVAGARIADGGAGARNATLELKDGRTVRTVLPSNYNDALVLMREKSVSRIEIVDAGSDWRSLLINASPFFMLLMLWILMMRRLRPKSPPPVPLV